MEERFDIFHDFLQWNDLVNKSWPRAKTQALAAIDSDQTKAEWLEEAQGSLRSRFPRLKAVVYFDTEGRRADGSVQFCEWGIDSSPAALNSMKAMLGDPRLDPGW